MDSTHREKFISLLKDSVLTLCKNGLMDDHHGITRVEGLLGITMQNKEVFLVNIREELLPPFVPSKKSKYSPGDKTHFEPPSKPATAATETVCRGSCISTTGDRQSRTSSSHSEAVTFPEVAVCCDDKENSHALGNDPHLRVAGNQFGKDEGQSRDKLSAMTVDSGDEDDTGVVDFSESVVRSRRMKDESDDLVCDVDDAPPSNQRKSSDGTLVYQSTTESESLFLWQNDPKGASLSGVPCGYLPLALGYRGHQSGFDDPSPPSSALPFPGLPMFYDGVESIPQAPSFSPRRNNLRPGGGGGAGRQLKKYCCDICSYRSNRSYNLLRHVMHVHAIGSGPCADCGIAFNHKMQLRAHRIAVHGDRDGMGISMDAGNSANAVKMEPEETVNS